MSRKYTEIVNSTTAASTREIDESIKKVWLKSLAANGLDRILPSFRQQYPDYNNAFLIEAANTSGRTAYIKLKAQNKSAEQKLYKQLVSEGQFKKKAYVTDNDMKDMWRDADSGNFDTGIEVIKHKAKSKTDETWEEQAMAVTGSKRVKPGYMEITSKKYRAELINHQLALPRATDIANLRLPDAMTSHIQNKSVLAVLNNHEHKIGDLELKNLSLEARLPILEGKDRGVVIRNLVEQGITQTKIAAMLNITTRTVRRNLAKPVN